ncbi:hypothetical protein PoB_000770700 [Plakobranchus ocellatus]|uniref:Uncharacterized protein n=1 Tax=Plakobranchus ocellatus TaxID=259542 RepID=A0AAV3YG59_9GAST|nr:hypothetical protein PoB_000770700 [Plakobranchus ocellatus]
MPQCPVPQFTRGPCLTGQNFSLVTHHASMPSASIYSWIMPQWSEPQSSQTSSFNVQSLNLLLDHVSMVRTSI